PRLRHLLHPGADEGHRLAREEDAEVAVAERAQAGGNGHRPRCRIPRATTARRLLRLRGQAEIGLERPPAVRALRLRLLVAHGGDDDDVLALLPVDRRGPAVLVGEPPRVAYRPGVGGV